MTPSEMFAEAIRLSALLDSGLDQMRDQGVALANAEHAYRKAKGHAWQQVLIDLPKGTVPEREAWVNARTAGERLARDLADANRQAALESVRSRRTQVSVLQTMANAHQEEAKFARTGPGMAA